MPSDTPDRDTILAHLRRLPAGARGSSAADLAGEVSRRANPAATTAGIRAQLAVLGAEGVVYGRSVHGAMRWVVTEAHRDPYNAAEVTALARLVEQAGATAGGLADLAREMGRSADSANLDDQAADLASTADRLRQLARTITT